MRRFFFLIPIFLWCSLGWAQTPTLVQHVSCPNSGALGSGAGAGQSNTPTYKCPLPEPTLAGNAIVLGFFSDNGGSPTWTVSDDKGNTWTRAGSTTDSNGNIIAVYYALNVAAGTRMLSVHNSGGTNGYLGISASEYYNVATSGALDTQSCTPGASSQSITAGSITPGTSGDLLWQWAANANAASVASFTAGSQSNITWQLNGTDIYNGDATQAGVYSSTSAINPTFTSGIAEPWDSCVMALKAAAAGNAPTSPFRVVHMLHQAMPKIGANPWPVEFPTSGNLLIASYISGGSLITSAASTPSNTWTATGPAAGNSSISAVSQIYYAANSTPSNSMTINFARDTNTSDGTYIMYDIVGASASPFDKDSGGQTANQTTQVTSFTTCSSCLTPSAADELIIANQGQNWCTAIASPSPSGSLFDAATFDGNSVNGPEDVDQNNGWLHYYDPNTSPITVTWTNNCTQAEGAWAGRVAAFQAAQSGALLPPTGLTAVVH